MPFSLPGKKKRKKRRNKFREIKCMKRFLLLGAMCFVFCVTGEYNMNKFPDRAEILLRLKKYARRPLFAPAADRKVWGNLPDNVHQELLRRAEEAVKSPWKMLYARDYMEYFRTGNRRTYQNPYFHNRFKLVDLVSGECCEYKGRFIDDIIEGLWQILSEQTWALPAHEAVRHGDFFPEPGTFQIELHSTETGKMLCDILMLLEPEISKRSAALVRRVKAELMRRIIEPAEKLNDSNTRWFSGRNNWTPWCAGNLTGCAIYLLEDQPERLAKFLETYFMISQRFYDRYPSDGGCNEGPTYWRYAAGKFVQQLIYLDHRLALDGKFFKDEKLRRMCDYLPGTNLCGNYFLSTADAAPKPDFAPQFLCFMAEKTRNSSLAGLALRLNGSLNIPQTCEMEVRLYDIFHLPPKNSSSGLAAVDYWKNLGIAILRSQPQAPETDCVAALKGGNNAESHNHLDLGHFSLFFRNTPLIVDIGAGVYTAATFSEKRYTLWNINETGHNAPRFSGTGQQPGAEYKAPLTVEGDSVCRVDLSKAYPAGAGIKYFVRELLLDRKNGHVTICDTVETEGKKTVAITLYSAVEPRSFSSNQVVWDKAVLKTGHLQIVSVAEEKRLDSDMKRNWGRLWRIELAGEICNSGSWEMKFDFNRTTGK